MPSTRMFAHHRGVRDNPHRATRNQPYILIKRQKYFAYLRGSRPLKGTALRTPPPATYIPAKWGTRPEGGRQPTPAIQELDTHQQILQIGSTRQSTIRGILSRQ